jgi:hypothetical protein
MAVKSFITLAAGLSHKYETSGLYYKHVTIVNYASSAVNKLRASLNDDAGVPATGWKGYLASHKQQRNKSI